MNLSDWGWDESFEDAFHPYREQGLAPGRVAVQHRGGCRVVTEAGDVLARGAAAVGDWVALDAEPAVRGVLPRRSAFSRKAAGLRTDEQVLAANVDTAFLVSSFGRDLEPRRLERYLAAAWDSGAAPAIVLTKLDLADDPDADIRSAEAVAFGVPVHPVGAVTGEGLDALGPYLAPGRTVVLLGSSGVGKSTLVNRLAGEELVATREVRAGDGRGRHTTTHRELVLLPGGGIVLDTPGMRELQLWADEEALDTTFAEIAALAEECRFADCAHRHEPGCAVLAAVENGSLPPERIASYRKLQRELRALEVRQDARLQAEARKDRRRFARAQRKARW